jgi:hypothetical protein
LERIERERDRGLTFIKLQCNHCSSWFSYDPQTGQLDTSCDDAEPLLRCPVVRCTGYVVDIEDVEYDEKGDGVFGCGECGTEWRNEQELAASIEEAIRRFPHRAGCYRRERGHWVPSEEGPDDDDHEDIVETEPYEPGG